MKKFIAVVLVICAVLTYKFYNSEKTRVLRVGMECAFEPNNWEEKKKSDSNMPLVNNPGFYAEGYDLQIAKIVADSLNANLEVKKVAWGDLFRALNEGEIDAIFSGMLDTSKRRENAVFSEPYDITKPEYTVMINTSSKYVNAKTLNDFAGAKFVAQKGTLLDNAIDQIPGVIHMTPVETVPEMLEAVIKGEADGTVINLDTGRSYEATHNNLKVIRFPEDQGFKLDFNGICAGVRKEDTKLLSEINDVITGISRKDRQKLMDNVIARLWRNM
jgi:ABC-type amino acid transport substrate-binding protein